MRGVVIVAAPSPGGPAGARSVPGAALKWNAPKISTEVDRRSVINPTQARALLNAVKAQEPSGTRLVAFFAMYYSALRPEEAIRLTRGNVTTPDLVWG